MMMDEDLLCHYIPQAISFRSAIRGPNAAFIVVRSGRRSGKHIRAHYPDGRVFSYAASDVNGTAQATNGAEKPNDDGLALSELRSRDQILEARQDYTVAGTIAQCKGTLPRTQPCIRISFWESTCRGTRRSALSSRDLQTVESLPMARCSHSASRPF